MKSSVMSLWLLTVFFGNIITAYVAQVNQLSGGNFFMFFTILMALVGVIFVFLARGYKVQNHMEKEGQWEDQEEEITLDDGPLPQEG